MNIVSLCKSGMRLLILTILVGVLAFGTGELSANALESTGCDQLNNIEGDYKCSGQCVTKGGDGLEIFKVSNEIDTVKYLRLDDPEFEHCPGYDDSYNSDSPDNMGYFYRVKIEGADDFCEVEIGPLTGLNLYTATTEVSDNIFPVVEQYSFSANQSCEAQSFTKVVSNPTEENFKSCVVECYKM